jgi:hypothetical protein
MVRGMRREGSGCLQSIGALDAVRVARRRLICGVRQYGVCINSAFTVRKEFQRPEVGQPVL